MSSSFAVTLPLGVIVPWSDLGPLLLQTALWAALGVGVFASAFWLFHRLSPFSLRKEIETDQNVAVAVIMGAVIIGIAIIVAAAISG